MPRIVLFWLILSCSSLRVCAGEPEFTDVFVPKTDGFKSIRIPSVVVSKRGTVLAFAEGRAAIADQAQNKILLKRSADGGRTWGPFAIIANDGERSLNNPCAVVERETGLVLLVFQSYPAGLRERSNKIETGYEGEMVVRNYLIITADEGASWSKPRDVTKETKRREKVTTVASGPGLGIQLRRGEYAGRLLIPFNEGPFGLWNIYAAFSDDKGRTWKTGEVAPGGLIDNSPGKKASTVNEAQLVELKDGSVRFNARRWAGAQCRKTGVSSDGGVTWSQIEDATELRDPSCMASIFRYTDPADGDRSRLLFSGPQSDRRENGTILLSYDEGATWPMRRVLVKDRFAYSVLTALDDQTIGCLFEADGMNRIVFARFTLEWLTDGRDRSAKLSRHQ
jgi:sialidase-1